MKMLIACVLGLTLCTSLSASAAEMTWDDQLDEMMYHIFHISGLNAMNALNLSHDQIRQLKALARKMEAAGVKAPAMRGTLDPGFAGVREAYRELTQTLLEGKEISPELKARVMQAREKEAQMIRASIRPTPPPGQASDCSRCHLCPDEFRGKEPAVSLESASILGNKLNASADKKSTDTAHVFSIMGYKGMQLGGQLAPQVDAILTDSQKQIMQDFACCLIPPAELSDPVRAGQAEVSEGALELLRRVRSAQDSMWPTARTNLIAKLKRMFISRNPDLTPEQLQRIEQSLTDLFEKTRKMSDAEFELSKETLCSELKMKPKPTADGRSENFKLAMFLLMPGSTEIYDALMKRTEAR